MNRRWWKGVAWVVAFVAALEALWLAVRAPGSDALTEDVRQVIERHQMRYYGDLTTRQFHRAECRSAATIPPRYRVLFLSRRAALEMGLTPCPQCQP
ncbi:hypothetical protein HRbin17_01522 [bacterium HR17]|jgi:hypothetical protein|uniref:Ada DNA repair metal-binding domain-containing protein n=1 Tax=Candidatus Fervidibacter japonicus TaxID=2035412 RepID=A0A2H5XCU3_9BACT|nr:hypothetical protein HRbin17_01522 [bacterium HR17]